ncbi:hypothetical protein [Chryseosolibacter indicus]|uniref:Uncharacterized protein n=1 Tax=Chryseosolibacter indicus TaxID=2782351 RepID=A0ABS5VLK7_9BACT|nr:hypothetical protein [Chryseosolibacter indicus]MBT1701888.1 hypothetical protein [Chryseosolibacter indicus]
MKTIRIVTGVKKIDHEANENILLFRVREVLNEHRSSILERMINDLPNYINYRFDIRASKEQLANIRNKLTLLKGENINADKYHEVIENVLLHETYSIPSQPFLQEIDEIIYNEINPYQLTLVK